MAGLTGKNGWESRISERYCGPSAPAIYYLGFQENG